MDCLSSGRSDLWRNGTSAAGERRDHQYLVARVEPARERALLRAVHEDLDVRADGVLLVDHAKADPGIAPVEVAEELGKRGALGLDLAPMGGVVGERRR